MALNEQARCIWSRGATDEVYKSTCSFVPFLYPKEDEPAQGTRCPFCGDVASVVDSEQRLNAGDLAIIDSLIRRFG